MTDDRPDQEHINRVINYMIRNFGCDPAIFDAKENIFRCRNIDFKDLRLIENYQPSYQEGSSHWMDEQFEVDGVIYVEVGFGSDGL